MHTATEFFNEFPCVISHFEEPFFQLIFAWSSILLMQQILTKIIFLCLDPDELETFDRAEYRQSGSSLDSNNDKKKKNQKLFKGFGMFK